MASWTSSEPGAMRADSSMWGCDTPVSTLLLRRSFEGPGLNDRTTSRLQA
jgi:hypothetical protein